MKLAEMVNARERMKAELLNLDKNYKASRSEIISSIAKNEAAIRMTSDGLDLEKVKLGLSIIDLGLNHSGERRLSVVADAMADIACGAPKLKRTYFGVKNYSSFGDQRCDCEYGMGPTHGSIVFRVGLKDRKAELSENEIDCALYVLANIDKVNSARIEQKKHLEA